MPSFAKALAEARASAGLALKDFALLAGVDVERARAWEAGELSSGDDIDRAALVFGLGVQDFLEGHASTSNMTLLFKRNRDAKNSRASAQLVDLETNLGPNRFCRAVMALARVHGLLGHAAPSLPALEVPDGTQNPGDPMAQLARRALGLDAAGPVPSMRQLLERLGVCVIVAATDEVDRRINGASTLAPVPAVLVARQSNDPWVLRMTMAHELGHLLFHAGRFSISPGVPPAQGAWALELDFERRELEADAFAAAFLAPRFAVQDLLQRTGLAPETPGAVAAVGSHFGVGKEVAINRIVDCMGLSMASRVRLRAMTTTWIGHFDADTFSDDETGLHRGELRRAALEAFDKGLLGTLAVREMLAIPPGVTLDGSPEPGFEQQRVQRLMQKLALEQGFSGVVTGVRQAGATWQAELSGPGGERYSMVALRSDERALDRVG